MPLGTNLSADVKAVFDSSPASAQAAANALAAAYHSYCSGAQFGASLPTLTTAQRDAMAATLAAALTVPGLPATAAGAYGTALTAYWTSIPVAGGSGTGVTTPPTGTAAMVGALTACFLNLANTKGSAAASIATALDTCTRTVIATLTLPPGPPTPTPIS